MSRLLAALLLTSVAVAAPKPHTDGVPLPDGAVARLGLIQFRFGGTPYTPVVFAPDGKHLAVGDSIGVSVFETATGRRTHRIKLPDKSRPRAMRFLADGKQLGVGSGDWSRTAEWTVHDLTTAKVVTTDKFMGKSQIFVIDSTADGSRVLIEDRFGKIFLWDVAGARELWEVEHKEATSTLPFTADGKHFVVSGSRKAELLDADTGKLVGPFPDPGPAFRDRYRPGLAPDGRIALGSDKGDTVAILSARGKERVRHLTADRRVERSFFSPDARYLVAPSEHGTQVWDLTAADDKGPVARLPAAADGGFSPDGKTLALADEGLITLRSVGDWKPILQPTEPASPVFRVRFLSGDRVLGLTRTGWVIWPAGGGPAKRLSDDSTVSPYGYSDVSADGTVAVDVLHTPGRGGDDRGLSALRVTDLTTGKDRRIPLSAAPWAPVLISPDGRFVSADIRGSEFVVFDATTGEALHRTKRPAGGTLFGATADADGEGLAWSAVGIFNKNNAGLPGRGSMYSEVTVTDHRTGRSWPMDPMPWTIYSGGARFTPDGTRVVVQGQWGGDHGADSVTVWDTRTWKRLVKWDRASGRIESGTLAPDHRSLTAGTMTGELAVVEVATGGERVTFKHDGFVIAAAFHPGGTKVVSCSPDGPVYVWDLLAGASKWDPEKADAVWADLISTDAKVAWGAMRNLRANPAPAVAFLKDRVKLPAPPLDETVAKWLKGLDAQAFAERERAQRELAAVADLVRPKLEAARKGATEEAARRLDQVLKSAEGLTPENLRRVRACEVLEGIGTAEALQVLKQWSAGPAGARLTVEATESTARQRPR